MLERTSSLSFIFCFFLCFFLFLNTVLRCARVVCDWAKFHSTSNTQFYVLHRANINCSICTIFERDSFSFQLHWNIPVIFTIRYSFNATDLKENSSRSHSAKSNNTIILQNSVYIWHALICMFLCGDGEARARERERVKERKKIIKLSC